MPIDQVEKKAYLNASPQQREAVRILLSKVLAVLRAQSLSYQTSHWQASGDSFYGDHLLFERLYTSVLEQIDTLAEKMVGYLEADSVALWEQTVLVASCCKKWSENLNHYARGLDSERAAQASIKAAYDGIKAANAMTLGLDDLLMSMASEHDANEYLLQRVLSNSGRTAALVEKRFPKIGSTWGFELTAAGDLLGDLQLKVGHPGLSWNKTNKQFDIFASDVRWDTARTVSITNPKTGNTALYRSPVPTRDGEGDVQYWVLRGPFGTSLKIWNT